jgi:biotin/methionine sulfoxide reductase
MDAAARGIVDGDIIRLHNDRGECLAGAVLSSAIRRGVIQLSTGAWYDPVDLKSDAPLDAHGNPNVLTADRGTSSLSQGPSAQSCLVVVERFDGELPPLRAFDPPEIISRA